MVQANREYNSNIIFMLMPQLNCKLPFCHICQQMQYHKRVKLLKRNASIYSKKNGFDSFKLLNGKRRNKENTTGKGHNYIIYMYKRMERGEKRNKPHSLA